MLSKPTVPKHTTVESVFLLCVNFQILLGFECLSAFSTRVLVIMAMVMCHIFRVGLQHRKYKLRVKLRGYEEVTPGFQLPLKEGSIAC